MIKYLTPSKIGLLLLIQLYTYGLVPNHAIIDILTFLTSRIIPQQVSEYETSSHEDNPSLTLEDFENVTKGVKFTMPGRNLYDALVGKMWQLNSLHALHVWFHQLSHMLLKFRSQADTGEAPANIAILISPVSPLGVFVRRAQLEFVRLQFDDTAKLWLAFTKFREPSEAVGRKKRPSATYTIDGNFAELGISVDSPVADIMYPAIGDGHPYKPEYSTGEIVRLLDFQLEKLQRFGNRLPEDVKATCQSMLKTSAISLSIVHFVEFFDSWRAGDYTMAFESLHRYFDYTVHTRDRSFYQYALLHMTILQADFGCFSEALAAMNETISTARENQDMNCLNFSLSWLNHLSKAYPTQMRLAGYTNGSNEEREGLLFLKTKAKEMNLPNLLSSALLSETKMILSMGESIYQAFERVYQAGHLNVKFNIQNSFGTQLLIHSALYGRLGFNIMGERYCDVLLDAYRNVTPLEEVLRACCRKAFAATQLGKYKDATNILEELYPKVKRNLRAYQYLATYSGLLKLKQLLRRHDLDAALHLLTQLTPSEGSPVIDPDLSFQISLLKIDYLQRLGSYDVALEEIEALAAKLKEEDADLYQRIHLLVMKAVLFDKVGKPQKGFTVAVRAANAAWQAKIVPALWEAWGCVANILGSLDEFDAERKILDAIMPQALCSGDLALCAQLYIWQSDAYMGLAGKSQDNIRLMTSFVSKAESYIDRASHCYKRIEDVRGECDTLHRKSIIARLRGDHALAEEWAGRYITLYSSRMKSLGDSSDLVEEGGSDTLMIS